MLGLQLCSASTQFRQGKLTTARGDVDAVLGEVREVRPPSGEQPEDNEVQLLHSDETCARFLSCEAAAQSSGHMALYRL